MLTNLSNFQITTIILFTVATIAICSYYLFAIFMAMKIKQKTLTVPVYKMIGDKKTLIGFLGSSPDYKNIEVKLYPSHAMNTDEVFQLFGECTIELMQQDYLGRIIHFNLVDYTFVTVKGGYYA